MLNRPAPESVTDNPLLDSPYNVTWEKGLGNFPINNNWLLLTGENFSMLEGTDWAFLGP
jgi:hypothetical protein